eukprot:Skav231879  [mRNA]  locus=scaffold54:270858:272192:- [translate_table: standard]
MKAPCALRRGHKSLPSHVDVSLSCYDRQGRQSFGMNLGVAVLKPSREELEKMLVSVQSRDPMHEACNGPEQDFLSRWFKNWTSMNLKYNYQLHQLARSLEHEGSEAERLQLKFENVKVSHYSGHIKPWDFYFETNSSVSFSSFCDEKLLPAYNAKGEDFEEKIRRAAQEWKEQCKAMWQHVLDQTSSTCKLCGESVVEEMRLEHCFLLCPAISDLQGHQLTLEEIQYPEPNEFQRILAFVASVVERHRWQAADFEDQGEKEKVKIKGPKERTAVGSDHSADSSERLSELAVAKSNQEKSEDEQTQAQEMAEHMQMPLPVETNPRKPKDQAPQLVQQTSEPKILHLVLQPQRSHDASPLGQWRERILKQVAENRVTIIVAPTGCGKSTRSLV